MWTPNILNGSIWSGGENSVKGRKTAFPCRSAASITLRAKSLKGNNLRRIPFTWSDGVTRRKHRGHRGGWQFHFRRVIYQRGGARDLRCNDLIHWSSWKKVRTKINVICSESRGVAKTSGINTRKVLTYGLLGFQMPPLRRFRTVGHWQIIIKMSGRLTFTSPAELSA